MNDLINQPDAPRLIYGLRDTGFSFNTAAADIIDNSIAANATEVNVRIELAEDGKKLVCFGDDGDGMDEAALFSAMRYGADSLTGQSVRRCVTGAIAFSAQLVLRGATAGTSAQGKQFGGALHIKDLGRNGSASRNDTRP